MLFQIDLQLQIDSYQTLWIKNNGTINCQTAANKHLDKPSLPDTSMYLAMEIAAAGSAIAKPSKPPDVQTHSKDSLGNETGRKGWERKMKSRKSQE